MNRVPEHLKDRLSLFILAVKHKKRLEYLWRYFRRLSGLPDACLLTGIEREGAIPADPGLGAMVRRLRRERGLTIRQLANLARVSYCTVNSIELARKGYQKETINKILAALSEVKANDCPQCSQNETPA